LPAGRPGAASSASRPAAALRSLAALLLAVLAVLGPATLASAVGGPRHLFPVRGPHGERGPIGEFGAPRDGGRVHEGFDVLAACGTELVAARGGKVLERGHDPVLYGFYVLIHGHGERRNYFYAHLRGATIVHRGELVDTGQRIGAVGRTGNARTVGCMLHFELRVHGRPIDPEPALRRWDRLS
jgi:murein DD-endopeptidase MepM/ murein hydrolase activator NlpD